MMMSCLMIKMLMTTAIAGKAFVMKYRVAFKEVNLVRGKQYILSFTESAVAYHLGEPKSSASLPVSWFI